MRLRGALVWVSSISVFVSCCLKNGVPQLLIVTGSAQWAPVDFPVLQFDIIDPRGGATKGAVYAVRELGDMVHRILVQVV